jgi:hypothetical protein
MDSILETPKKDWLYIIFSNSNPDIQPSKKRAVFTVSLVLYHGILFLPIENKFVLVMAITIPHNIQYL